MRIFARFPGRWVPLRNSIDAGSSGGRDLGGPSSHPANFPAAARLVQGSAAAHPCGLQPATVSPQLGNQCMPTSQGNKTNNFTDKPRPASCVWPRSLAPAEQAATQQPRTRLAPPTCNIVQPVRHFLRRLQTRQKLPIN